MSGTQPLQPTSGVRGIFRPQSKMRFESVSAPQLNHKRRDSAQQASTESQIVGNDSVHSQRGNDRGSVCQSRYIAWLSPELSTTFRRGFVPSKRRTFTRGVNDKRHGPRPRRSHDARGVSNQGHAKLSDKG